MSLLPVHFVFFSLADSIRGYPNMFYPKLNPPCVPGPYHVPLADKLPRLSLSRSSQYHPIGTTFLSPINLYVTEGQEP